ncbi:TniB family NTP-binding protein [Microcoleus vaginatus]|uniref:TniB family NTP-binding protein n=1 Tax=Microcoleus vaginatus TaxID=119532 RepID=UPI004040B39E
MRLESSDFSFFVEGWLEGKRQSRQSGRVVGESRTGKTMGCDAYRLRHKPKQQPGQPPTVPVAYIQIPQECGAKELFGVILENLKYQVVKRTIAEIRDRPKRSFCHSPC